MLVFMHMVKQARRLYRHGMRSALVSRKFVTASCYVTYVTLCLWLLTLVIGISKNFGFGFWIIRSCCIYNNMLQS